jgi:hypothetical protein
MVICPPPIIFPCLHINIKLKGKLKRVNLSYEDSRTFKEIVDSQIIHF